jgi:hypothetical protein
VSIRGGLSILNLHFIGQVLRLDGFGLLGVRHIIHGKASNFIPVDEEDKALFNAAFVVHLGNGREASFWTSKYLAAGRGSSATLARAVHAQLKK